MIKTTALESSSATSLEEKLFKTKMRFASNVPFLVAL